MNCNPVPNTNLEFWHASSHGNYDNIGYEFIGHQQSDAFGRFFLKHYDQVLILVEHYIFT